MKLIYLNSVEFKLQNEPIHDVIGAHLRILKFLTTWWRSSRAAPRLAIWLKRCSSSRGFRIYIGCRGTSLHFFQSSNFSFQTRFYSRIFKNIRKKKTGQFWSSWRVLSLGPIQKMIYPRFPDLKKSSEFNLAIGHYISKGPAYRSLSWWSYFYMVEYCGNF